MHMGNKTTGGKPVVGTMTETLGLNTAVKAPQRSNILSIQSNLALCSCLLPGLLPSVGELELDTAHLSLSLSLTRGHY